ncbi:MAG: hypothetical protein IPL21_01800 [Saprospirales bacterium]|nr:hypothetical protein [Saprospirales bacterium]
MYSDYAKVVDFSIYKNEGAAQFEKVYQHFSTNPHYFEFTAIEKYFFSIGTHEKSAIRKNTLHRFRFAAFGNVTKVINKYYDSYDFCSCLTQQEYDDFYWSASGHLSLWSRQALEEFCDFILKVYTEESQIENLKIKWQWHLDNNISGGICDMTLIYLYLRETKLKTGNFLSVLDNQFSFDNALKGNLGEFPDEYEMKYSFLLGNFSKKISFKNGSPTCYNKLYQKDILLYFLHYQAEAKRLMPMLVGGKKNLKNTWQTKQKQ